jgi:prepilin-type N-terminal cleavage/methylation domain-containing protein
MRSREVRVERAGWSGGHTLWEVLLVLALIGVVATIAAPALGFVGRPDDALTETTRDVVVVLNRVRLTALERGTAIELRLDPTNGRVWLFAVDTDSLRVIGATTLPRASTVGGGARSRVRFRFTPAGAAFGDTLVLRGSGVTRRISVDPWTGGAYVATR